MRKHKLTYDEALIILLNRKYPGIFMRGGVNLTENKDISPDDPNRYIRAPDRKTPSYVKPERRKLNINPELREALSSIISNKPVSYIPEAPPIAPPMAPEAPSFFPTPTIQEARVIPMNQQFVQPMSNRRNFVDELKDYKEGIEYVRDMCPLLKGIYNKKNKNKKDMTLNQLEKYKKGSIVAEVNLIKMLNSV